jgi:hypothetical protein
LILADDAARRLEREILSLDERDGVHDLGPKSRRPLSAVQPSL